VPRRLIRGESATRTFAELLTDCEEDLRAVLVGMLREAERSRRPLARGRGLGEGLAV
jgi:hypothetical protein